MNVPAAVKAEALSSAVAWSPLDVRLPFRMGGITLFTLKRPLLVRWLSLGDLDGDVARGTPDPALLGRDRIGFLVRSQPVDRSQPRLSLAGGLLRFVRSEYDRFLIDLTGTAEDYLGRFSAKSRETLGRKERRFAKLSGGNIDWREYRNPEEIEAFFALAGPLAEKTYQERLMGAGLPCGEEFRLQAKALAAEDQVRAYLLFLDGRPVSYLYFPGKDGVLVYGYVGYDPDFGAHSPGTVLQWLAVRRLFEEGRFRLLDFAEGEGDHKRFFSTGSRRCADIVYLRYTAGNLAIIGTLWLCEGMGSAAGLMLDRLGLKARARRILRGRWRNRWFRGGS